MIPPFVNDLIYMLKDSAILSVIGGAEITSKLNLWRVRYGSNPLPYFVIAIALYLLLSLPMSYFARSYERRLRSVQ
jgi:ABC-type amino acid transport system permease subunit